MMNKTWTKIVTNVIERTTRRFSFVNFCTRGCTLYIYGKIDALENNKKHKHKITHYNSKVSSSELKGLFLCKSSDISQLIYIWRYVLLNHEKLRICWYVALDLLWSPLFLNVKGVVQFQVAFVVVINKLIMIEKSIIRCRKSLNINRMNDLIIIMH